ncbi:MAG: ATP synthase F1 subunit epsilon, partial [Gaiellales bacterium]
THTPFPVKVVTPEGVLFNGAVRELIVTSVSGQLGILDRRAPVVADLKRGQVRAELEDGTWLVWATEEGFAQASNSTATVVVEEAIDAKSITAAKAQELIAGGNAKLVAAGDDEAEIRIAQREITWGEHLASFKAE